MHFELSVSNCNLRVSVSFFFFCYSTFFQSEYRDHEHTMHLHLQKKKLNHQRWHTKYCWHYLKIVDFILWFSLKHKKIHLYQHILSQRFHFIISSFWFCFIKPISFFSSGTQLKLYYGNWVRTMWNWYCV